MKYVITTSLRQGILDNAGKAVTSALHSLGFLDVTDARISKTITLECDPADIEAIAKTQVNEVMENYTIEVVD